MDIPITAKLTYSKGKAGKTFTEYTLNETANYPETLRVVKKREQNFLSIKEGGKWVQCLLCTTDHFHFYAVSVPFRGTEIILVVHYKPSSSMIEVRVWKDVSVERGKMAELNELINLIIYQF
ncbi:hypothetical protein [Kaistella sp.]|uniref:hypothetical protein n=1 Tax=Kaistella sp. TaxID=2782235 RepID=UPI0035A0448D